MDIDLQYFPRQTVNANENLTVAIDYDNIFTNFTKNVNPTLRIAFGFILMHVFSFI